jgi:hypothetical protein
MWNSWGASAKQTMTVSTALPITFIKTLVIIAPIIKPTLIEFNVKEVMSCITINVCVSIVTSLNKKRKQLTHVKAYPNEILRDKYLAAKTVSVPVTSPTVMLTMTKTL